MKSNPKVFSEPRFFRWSHLALMLGVGWMALSEIAGAAEPLMDIGVFELSRGGGLNLVKEGKFQDALLVEKRALQISQDQLGPLHPSLVPILNDLGTLHRYLAEYQKSEEDYKWGLALLEKNAGPDHSPIADSLDHLAALYDDLGRLREAELLEKTALPIRKADAFRTPAALQTLFLLGHIEWELHDYTQARLLIRQAQEALEKMPHPDAHFSINLWNALARTYGSENNFTEVQACRKKALDLAQKYFPGDGVEVADAMENLADFYHSQKQEDQAQPLYESALKIDRRFVGTYYEFPSLPYMKRLARAYFSTGKFKEAAGLWRNVLLTEKKVFGPRHPRVALDLVHLAEVESALKEKKQARKDLKEALGLLKSVFPNDHPWVARVQAQMEKQ